MSTKTHIIINALKEKYHPVAIILHGSRAVGKDRPNSDWDIIMLFKGEIPRKSNREMIDDADVEWKAATLPVETVDIFSAFNVHLQFAKVLWEEYGEGTDILRRASEVYAKGPNLSQDEVRRERLFMEHKLLGMQDDIDMSAMFLRHLGVFFNRSSNLWFEILHNEFPKPYYLAIPEIQQRDPGYSKYLSILSSGASNEEKIETGKGIMKKLFN